MTESMIVKSDFNGDIRRFAVPKLSFTFKYVKTTLSVLYQLSPESISLYNLRNGVESEVVSDENLVNSVDTASGNGSLSRIVVRTNEKPIERGIPRSKEEVVELPKLEVPIQLSDEFIEKLMEHPKVQDKICEIVSLILSDKKIVSSIAKKVTKRQNRIAKKHSFQLSNESVRNNSEEHSQAEEIKTPVEEELKDNLNKEVEEPKLAEAKIEEVPKQEEDTPSEKTSSNDSIDDFEVIPSLNNSSNSPKENKISDAIDAKIESLSTSPIIQSFLSIFKPKEKKPEEKPISEELLKQLDDMGFKNRESNIKAFQFHNKFNEGIDAVVEDLLQQEGEKKEV